MKKLFLHQKIFLSYMIIILSLSFFINMSYIFIEIPKLRDKTLDTITQNNEALLNVIDGELDNMNKIATTIVYSNSIKELYSSYSHEKIHAEYASLTDLVALILGPIRSVDQVNCYALDGSGFSVGLRNYEHSIAASNMIWFDSLNNSDLNDVSFFSGEDESLSKYKTSNYSKYFITTAMKLYDNYNNVFGYVEIKKNMDNILTTYSSYSSIFGEKIYIFDKNGTQVFPLNENNSNIYELIKSHNFKSNTNFKSMLNNTYFNCMQSEFSDLVTVITIDGNRLLYSIFSNIFFNILFTFCFIVLSFFLAYILSKSVTKPIKLLYHNLKEYTLNSQHPYKAPETDTVELDYFIHSFYELQTELLYQSNEKIQLQNQKTQAQMISLRSQMNPHFMYNSLATIVSMAEENMNDSIIDMCQLMSKILRYISSDKEDQVNLSEELSHTEDYLKYMCIRHQGDLSYDIDISQNLHHVKVAKLSIQQFVENSIKHMTANKLGPYYITINAKVKNNCFFIRIMDNGTGFDKEILNELNNQIDLINKTNMLPQLEINGMGILNVYIRLRNIYKDNLIFTIKNLKNSGTCITIGGPYEG